jgi:hypothetical protein
MLGDANETLEVVDMAQLLARSALKDGSGGGESALYGMDASWVWLFWSERQAARSRLSW